MKQIKEAKYVRAAVDEPWFIVQIDREVLPEPRPHKEVEAELYAEGWRGGLTFPLTFPITFGVAPDALETIVTFVRDVPDPE